MPNSEGAPKWIYKQVIYRAMNGGVAGLGLLDDMLRIASDAAEQQFVTKESEKKMRITSS